MTRKLFLLLLISCVISACNTSTDEQQIDSIDNFDRGVLLADLTDGIIIPAYQDFAGKMATLKSAGQNFTVSPDVVTLDVLRTAWYNAYRTWQKVEMFNIGKAEELQYSFYMNVYPLSVADVENNVENGGYSLNAVNNQDAQGFPALDYLLYGVADNDTDILAKYTTDVKAAGYKDYITNVLNQMDELTQQVLSDWTGSYRTNFVQSADNTTTSSLNKLVNDFIFYYEKGLRANKIGIPAGIFSSSPLANKVEAFYKGDISKELATVALQAVENFFNGKQYNGATSGESFRSYLNYLQREDISTGINNQLNVAQSQLSGLTNSFYQQVNTDNTQMTLTYDELQKVVILLKVDMLQAMNINVDYVDADGD